MTYIGDILFWILVASVIIGVLIIIAGVFKLLIGRHDHDNFTTPRDKYFALVSPPHRNRGGRILNCLMMLVLMAIAARLVLYDSTGGITVAAVVFAVILVPVLLKSIYSHINAAVWRLEISGSEITHKTLFSSRHFSYMDIEDAGESVLEADERTYREFSFTTSWGKTIFLNDQNENYDLFIGYLADQGVTIERDYSDNGLLEAPIEAEAMPVSSSAETSQSGETEPDIEPFGLANAAHTQPMEIDSPVQAQPEPRRKAGRIIVAAIIILTVANMAIMLLLEGEPIIIHDDRLEIKLYQGSDSPFNPLGILAAIRDGYEVYFTDIVNVALLPYSVRNLGRNLEHLRVPHDRLGQQARHTFAGYYHGVRFHAHVSLNSSYTIWIDRENTPPVLISRGNIYQDWIEYKYRSITRSWLNSGTDEERIYRLRNLSAEGHIEAIRWLVMAYAHGNGVPQDYARATYWTRIAAPLGDPWFQRNLGASYFNGRGVERDTELAMYWLYRAAAQDYILAIGNIGYLYLVYFQDYETALYWNQKAATGGDSSGMVNLGTMYYNGRGVTQCYETARYWYRRAALQDYPVGQYNLGMTYEYGKGVDISLSQAMYWYGRAAELGFPDAVFAYVRLGGMR